MPPKSGRREGNRLSPHHQSQLRRRRAGNAHRQTTPMNCIPQVRRSPARSRRAPSAEPMFFIERYIRRAKHIEVQILGDQYGNIVHLWERDCSVHRRHQKVVEVRPEHQSAAETSRSEICDAAVRLCKAADYRNAGNGRIPSRSGPRRVLLHRSQSPHSGRAHRHGSRHRRSISSRARFSLPRATSCTKPPINIPAQDKIEPRGYAIQCRITTEDPQNHFIPDYGRLTTYRSAGGFRHPPRRRHRLQRRGHHALLRFAAGEADCFGR